jgi:hypothetical protein
LSFDIGVYKLTDHFVNQRFLPKLANTLDNIRVSLEDKLHSVENISQVLQHDRLLFFWFKKINFIQDFEYID